MSNLATISISSFPQNAVAIDRFTQEVESLQLSSAVQAVVESPQDVLVVLTNDVQAADQQAIDAAAAAHVAKTSQDIVRETVAAAIAFGQDLIVDFAAENVLMGITQAGKTKDVADYLSNVMRYAQSGSLYEVIAEVDRLVADGLPANLEPFITTARMAEFKSRVEAYLGI